jgi:hypothetical protein
MSARFVATSNEGYEWGGTGVSYEDYSFSMQCWVKWTSSSPSDGLFFGIAGGQNTLIHMRLYGTGRDQWTARNESYKTADKARRGAENMVDDTWYHLVYTDDVTGAAGTYIKMYRDGVEETYANTSDGSGAQTACNDEFNTGLSKQGTQDIDADIAEIAVWRRVLTPDEVKMLATGASPLFLRKDLDFYAPMRRGVSDYCGQGPAETTHGTPEKAPHPPGIYYPASAHVYKSTVVAGADFIPALNMGCNF